MKNISTRFLIAMLASVFFSTHSFAERYRTVTIPAVNQLRTLDITTTSVTLYWGVPYNLSEDEIAAFEIYKDNVLQEVVPSTACMVQSLGDPHWSHQLSGVYEASSHVFSIKVKPIASITDYAAQTASITVETPARSVPGVYYIPYGTLPCSYLDHGGIVGQVQFNTINNTSTSFNHVRRYTDFTGISTNVAKGTTYYLTVKAANPIAPRYPIGQVSYAAWIDFNKNFKFDPNELVLIKNLITDELVSVPVTIPTTAVEGPTRLRVLVNNIESRYMGPVEPVDFTTVGEFEDYTINILDSQAPSAPSNLAASNVSATSLTLNWTASTDNIAVTGYDIYANDILFKTVTTNTINLSGLTQGKSYAFYVKAKDAAGNVSTASNTVSVTTADTQAPTTPASLAATAVTGTSLTLKWTPSTDNVGVAGYDVYRDGTLFTTVTTNVANITGLSQYTAYKFYVKAKDAAGNVSDASNTVSVTTADTQAPTTPASLAATAVTGTSLTLKWTPSTDNVGVAGYDVYKDGTLFTTVTTNVANITGLSQYTAYKFYVKAKDAAGNVSTASNTVSVTTADTQAPTTPASLAATLTGTSLTLNWKASSDNVAVIGYDVYKDGTLFTTVTTNVANITGLSQYTAYKFYVKAKDAAGNVSTASNTVSVTTTDTQAPTTPASLAATAVTGTSLTLKWTPSADNVGVAGYDVYKDGTLFTTVTTNVANITGLSQYTAYKFYVKAKDAAGNVSTASNTVSVTTADTQAPTTPASLAATLTGTSLTLNWKASSDNVAVTGYDVYRDGILYGTTTTNSITINKLSGGTTYKFYVKAKDAAGNISASSNTVSITTSGKKSLAMDVEEATAAASKIVIYPNPTEAQLFISDIERIESIYIFDSFGKQVYATKASNEINVSNLPSGVYLIRLKFKDGSTDTSRFIKK